MSFPNTFIVGAAKAGTTSLHYYLGQHPQVFMSEWKEPHHFADIAPAPELTHMMRRYADEPSYTELFRDAGTRPIVGEASPSYLWDFGAAARIRARVPKARIIILLRDPIARAYSHYLMDVREGLQQRPFLEAVRSDYALQGKRWGSRGHLYVELGLYADQLARYYAAFPADRIRVHLFDDLQTRPLWVLEDLAQFLGIDAGMMASINTSESRNAYARPRGALSRALMAQSGLRQAAQVLVPARLRRAIRDRILLRRDAKPATDPAAITYLRELFEPDVQRLEALLKRPLPELRTSWGLPGREMGAQRRE